MYLVPFLVIVAGFIVGALLVYSAWIWSVPAAAVASAEGQKQVAILQAQAQAEAIDIIQQQLDASPKYIEYLYAKSWNGVLPTTLVLSNGAVFPLIGPLAGNSDFPQGTNAFPTTPGGQ